MHLPDLSILVLSSTAWLLVGLLLYYLLALFKVYILAQVQPKLYKGMLEAENPFKNLMREFVITLYSDMTIYKATFIYLFRYRKSDWPVMDNERVKRRLEIIDGVIGFLKPYLIIALAFCLLRIWIGTRLFYHPLTITLGEIQQNLVFIHNLSFINFLTKHKTIILFLYGVIVALIIIRASREAAAKKLKKSISTSLVYLSILVNGYSASN